jgi:predicted nucleic-acid-binding protein
MVLFDTNAILRYVLQDNVEMADRVERQLRGEVCYVPVEVMAELVYVLTKVYGAGRETVASTLRDLADLPNVRAGKDDVVRHALGVFASSSLDFVDCLLVGYARQRGYAVFTFDKALQKHLKP